MTIEWRCFHCDEVFTDKAEAREHFGEYLDDSPACLIKGEDGGLIKRVRELEAEVLDAYNQRNAYENDARLWHEAEVERKRLQGRYQLGRDTSWFMFLDSLEGERLVLQERVKELEVLLVQRAQAIQDCQEECDRQTECALTSQAFLQREIDRAEALEAALTARTQALDQVQAAVRDSLPSLDREGARKFPNPYVVGDVAARLRARLQEIADAARVSRAPTRSRTNMTERSRVKCLTCKRCGCGIETGLCGYGCDLDNTPASARRPEDLEVRVYEFVGIEDSSGQVAALLPASVTRQDVIARIVQEVAELPDRTSPYDWPDAMLVTADELSSILAAALRGIGDDKNERR